MPNIKQANYIKAHLSIEPKFVGRLTVADASKVIDAIRHVYNSMPPAQRHIGKAKIVDQITNKFWPRTCTTCHKPAEPINSTESCSC